METLKPTCPWCGWVDNESYEGLAHGDIWESNECHECGSCYTVEVVLKYKTKQEIKYEGFTWWLRDDVSKGYWFFDKEPEYYPEYETWMDEDDFEGSLYPDGHFNDAVPQVVINEKINHGELAEVFSDNLGEIVKGVFENEWKWEDGL